MHYCLGVYVWQDQTLFLFHQGNGRVPLKNTACLQLPVPGRRALQGRISSGNGLQFLLQVQPQLYRRGGL